MRRLNLLLTGVLSATLLLLLGACGNEDAEKKENSKKSESVEKKKEAPKKEAKKDTTKKDNESTEQTEQVATEEPQSQEQQQQPVQQEPTDQEKAEDNAEVAKQNGYTGIPNGDVHSDVPVGQQDENYANHDAEFYDSLTEEEFNEMKAEAEKEALREKYNGGLSSGEMQTKHAIEQGYYDGDNADEVMAEIEKSEQEIADGKYDQYKE